MCPKCGGPVHRSRTRGLGEKLVKLLTANRTYRCFECGWRGWLQAADISQLRESRRRQLVRTIISVLLTILITALIALYLVRNSHASALPLPKSNVPVSALFDQGVSLRTVEC
jgi:DNA-directed RNA polymerase subunit RPC12/RpoP